MKKIKIFNLLFVLLVSFSGSLFAQKDPASATANQPVALPNCAMAVEKSKAALQIRADEECRSLTQSVSCVDEKGNRKIMSIVAHPGKNCQTCLPPVNDLPAANGKRVPAPFDVEILQSVCYREGVTLEAFFPAETADRLLQNESQKPLEAVKPGDGKAKISNPPYVPGTDYTFQWTLDGKKMGTTSRLECAVGKEARLEVTQTATKIKVSKVISLVPGGCGTPDAKMGAPGPTPPPAPVSNLVASFRRTSCFGTCPSYEVKFFGDGQVEWNGIANVSKLGKHRATIHPDKFKTMHEKATFLKFWEMKSYYPEEGVILDAPSTIIYLKMGGHEKQVENIIGAPQGFLDLEAFLDKLIGELAFKSASPTKTNGTIAPTKE